LHGKKILKKFLPPWQNTSLIINELASKYTPKFTSRQPHGTIFVFDKALYKRFEKSHSPQNIEKYTLKCYH